MKYKLHVCSSNRNTKPKQIHQIQTKIQTDNNILAEIVLRSAQCLGLTPSLLVYQAQVSYHLPAFRTNPKPLFAYSML